MTFISNFKCLLFSFYRVIKSWDNGFIAYLKNKYFPGDKECHTDVPPNGKWKTLTLRDLSFTFIIIGAGVPLSILAFIFENLFARICCVKKQN